MYSVAWWVIAGLACWRITSILHRETIFQPFRQRIGIFPDGSTDDSYSHNFITQLFECFMCLSVWVGFVCVLALVLFPYLLLPFALSAVAILFDKRVFYG
jgi:hypothetical protein